MTTDEKGQESGPAKSAVLLGAVIGAVVFGWLGYHSAPAQPADIQDAYDGPVRMFLGLIFGFVVGGIVAFAFVMGGLVVSDWWARLRGR